MFDQFGQQVNRLVAVGLQVFHGLLARPQGCNFRFQSGNILDLPFKHLDFGAQHIVFALLTGYLGLVPKVNATRNQTTQQGGSSQRQVEKIAPVFARGFPVGKQVDQDHCMNLRSARPHEVR